MWVTCSCDKQLKFEVTGPDKERLEQDECRAKNAYGMG